MVQDGKMVNKRGLIPIARPDIGDEEIEAVTDVLSSGMLAQGRVVGEFESIFSHYIGVGGAVAVSSGTVGLDLALKALEIGQGDEVITTPFTFIATANAILYQGARPVFADIDEQSFTIDPDDLLKKMTSKTRAVVGVHLFGHPFELKAVLEICEDHNLFLVEDCAQAHGAEYNGLKVGSFGSVGCFSFYPTKNMTTGEGGMITSNNDKIIRMCNLLRNHGEVEKYLHTILGYNYRMTDIQAAIGCVQLKRVDRMNEMRIKNAEYLNKHLSVPGLRLPIKKNGVKHVYHQYAVTISEEDGFPLSRDELMAYLREKGIECAVHYPRPVHRQPLYQRLGYTDEAVNCPVATEISERILSLPVHPGLSREDLRYIAESVNSCGEWD